MNPATTIKTFRILKWVSLGWLVTVAAPTFADEIRSGLFQGGRVGLGYQARITGEGSQDYGTLRIQMSGWNFFAHCTPGDYSEILGDCDEGALQVLPTEMLVRMPIGKEDPTLVVERFRAALFRISFPDIPLGLELEGLVGVKHIDSGKTDGKKFQWQLLRAKVFKVFEIDEQRYVEFMVGFDGSINYEAGELFRNPEPGFDRHNHGDGMNYEGEAKLGFRFFRSIVTEFFGGGSATPYSQVGWYSKPDNEMMSGSHEVAYYGAKLTILISDNIEINASATQEHSETRLTLYRLGLGASTAVSDTLTLEGGLTIKW